MLRLGEARVRGGERALGSSAFREAAALAERLGDGASLARAAIGASRRYVQPPGVVDTELIAMIERALELQPERSLVRVRLLACLCGAIYYSPERDRMPALSDEAMAIAAELGDPEARAYACSARRRVLWDAPHLAERIEVSTEMLTLARQIGNLELQLQAHAWLVVDLLERGDRDAVDAQIEAFEAGGNRLRQRLYEWNSLVWRAMLALLAGSFDRADRLASEALATGAPGEAVTASQYYAIQVLGIRRDQGTMGELEPAARQLIDENPGRPAWRAALATLLCEDGRLSEAREEFDRLAVSEFEDIPKDLDWMIAIVLLSDVCADLGDGERAALLYAKLEPYADVNVVIGLAAVCLGSAASFLGRLAATMGRSDEARRHFERALEANAALRAPACLARTQVDYARALGPGPRADELVAAAGRTASELGLGAVARKIAELPGSLAGRQRQHRGGRGRHLDRVLASRGCDCVRPDARSAPVSRPVVVLVPKLCPPRVTLLRARRLGAVSSSSVPVLVAPRARMRTTRAPAPSLMTTTRIVWSGARVAQARTCRAAGGVGETVRSRDPTGAACANISNP